MAVGAILGWIVLGELIARHLKRAHHDLYVAMGSPSVFMLESDESRRAHWRLMRFILRRDHPPLGDTYLSTLSDFAFAYVFALAFLWLLILAW